VFDGGPTTEGRLALLKTVARARTVGVATRGSGPAAGAWHLAANRHCAGWRATVLSLDATAPTVALAEPDAAALGLAAGDALQVAALDLPPWREGALP